MKKIFKKFWITQGCQESGDPPENEQNPYIQGGPKNFKNFLSYGNYLV